MRPTLLATLTISTLFGVLGWSYAPAQDPNRRTIASEAPLQAVALSADGTLRGRIRDSADRPLAGAEVVLTLGDREHATTVSDAAGAFQFRGLHSGAYVIAVGSTRSRFDIYEHGVAPEHAAIQVTLVSSPVTPVSGDEFVLGDVPKPRRLKQEHDTASDFEQQLQQVISQVAHAEQEQADSTGSDVRPLPEAEDPGDAVTAQPASLIQPEPDPPTPQENPALIAAGEFAFQASCVDCHDAARALQKRKSLSAWVATVRRMASKDGADISPSDVRPIAAYLASLNPVATDGAALADDGDLPGQTTVFGTISTLWRGADHRNLPEHPGFFVDAWFGADWRPQGPMSGRVTACTSCHATNTTGGRGFTFELVEAMATLDILHAIHGADGPPPDTDAVANVKAGRFIVPFGAFSAMSHPGAYRTLTNPLMFNMGRRVFGNVGPPRQPVLPAPYADEGVDLFFKLPIHCDLHATMDLYAVNGLQQAGGGMFFSPSRSYTDNNAQPAFGGRATVGNRFMRFGGSVMAGELQTAGPAIPYQLSGVDVTAQYKDFARFYFEYALRSTHTGPGPGSPEDTNFGIVAEGELRVWKHPRIGLLARYDTLEWRDSFGPDATLQRFTWGLNSTLPGGSLLILNHEHWMFPDPQEDIDLFGFRWVATF